MWETDYTKVWSSDYTPEGYADYMNALNIIEHKRGWSLQLHPCPESGLRVPFMTLRDVDGRREEAIYLFNRMYEFAHIEELRFHRDARGELGINPIYSDGGDEPWEMFDVLLEVGSIIYDVNALEWSSVIEMDLDFTDEHGLKRPELMVGGAKLFNCPYFIAHPKAVPTEHK